MQTETRMKGHKVRPGRGCGYVLPLPIAVLMCSAFFFLGYYVSLSNNQDIVVENDLDRVHRQKLLENGEGDIAEHGVTGDDKLNVIPFQVLSWKPRALLFPGFANKQQCEAIIKLAKSKLKPSGLALRKGETADATKDVRTSSGTFLSAYDDKTGTLRLVEERMAKATMIPREHGEIVDATDGSAVYIFVNMLQSHNLRPLEACQILISICSRTYITGSVYAFNVLRYEIGQKYNSHYDVFNPAEYGPQKSQRMASFLLYLSDVEDGGETMFPFENYQNMNIGYDYKQCLGLRVKPKQGDALLFYSMNPNGTFDAAALHGSCPVISGEKWVATKWIRDSMNR